MDQLILSVISVQIVRDGEEIVISVIGGGLRVSGKGALPSFFFSRLVVDELEAATPTGGPLEGTAERLHRRMERSVMGMESVVTGLTGGVPV